MRWPWVSRRVVEERYEQAMKGWRASDKLVGVLKESVRTLREDRDHQRARVETLEGVLTHMLLAKAGITRRDGSKRQPPPTDDRIPAPIVQMINGFTDPTIRDVQIADIARARERGKSWDEIEAEMTAQLEGPDEEVGEALGRYLDALDQVQPRELAEAAEEAPE